MPEGVIFTVPLTVDEYLVIVDIPAGQDVELSTRFSDNQLTISGKVVNKEETKAEQLFRSGPSYNVLASSQFSQTLVLPVGIDNEEITIDQDETEIKIRIPKLK